MSTEGRRIVLKQQKLKFRFHQFRQVLCKRHIIHKHDKEIHQLFSFFAHLQADGLSLCGSMLMKAGEMCAVMWLPVTCRFPCVLEYACSLDTPARLALASLRGPFLLGSAPLSCICRQLYLDVGTNTFLPGYEVQLTEEA